MVESVLYEVCPPRNRFFLSEVNKTVGVVNLASPVGVVNLTPPVGVVNLTPPVGVVNLTPPVGVVNLSQVCEI